MICSKNLNNRNQEIQLNTYIITDAIYIVNLDFQIDKKFGQNLKVIHKQIILWPGRFLRIFKNFCNAKVRIGWVGVKECSTGLGIGTWWVRAAC